MGKAEALGDKVFRAIHVDRDRLDTVDKLAALPSVAARRGHRQGQCAGTHDLVVCGTRETHGRCDALAPNLVAHPMR